MVMARGERAYLDNVFEAEARRLAAEAAQVARREFGVRQDDARGAVRT